MKRRTILRDHLCALEQLLMRPAVRRTEALVDHLLDDEFCEVESSGAVFGKQQAIQKLREEAPGELFLQDFHVLTLAPEVVLTTYRATSRGALGRVKHFLRSSIWKRQSGQWRMVFHQGTRCDALVHEMAPSPGDDPDEGS